MKAIDLKTEHMNNPLGIDITNPVSSWNCQDGISQTACCKTPCQGGCMLSRKVLQQFGNVGMVSMSREW